jgi:hypothetical protein
MNRSWQPLENLRARISSERATGKVVDPREVGPVDPSLKRDRVVTQREL